jgi:hypothetical protein
VGNCLKISSEIAGCKGARGIKSPLLISTLKDNNMATVLTAMIFLVVAFAFMGAALTFAQYRKKQQSCCGDALEIHEQGSVEDSSCFTCPRRVERENCEEDPETCVHTEEKVVEGVVI